MQLPTLDYSSLKPTKYISPIAAAAPTATLILLAPFLLLFTDSELAAVIAFSSPLIAVLIFVLVSAYNSRQRNDALMLFANSNGLNYAFDSTTITNLGLIFNEGHSRTLAQGFAIPTSTSPIELGNFEYTTGSGKSARFYNYGYMRLKLPRRLPHMLLDATSNNFFRFSNLPKTFGKDQKLVLEGDFNKHFTLYAPKKYERDALYIFTPDVMAALVQHAKDFDVEVIDNELFLYSSNKFDFTRQRSWERLLYIASMIHPQFDAQTDYYADDRVGGRLANIVSADGRRLKPGFNWIAVLVIAAIIGGNLFSAFGFTIVDQWAPGILLIAVLIALLKWASAATNKRYY